MGERKILAHAGVRTLAYRYPRQTERMTNAESINQTSQVGCKVDALLETNLGNARRTVAVQLVRSSDGIAPRSLFANPAPDNWPLFVRCGPLIARRLTRWSISRRVRVVLFRDPRGLGDRAPDD
jgi:hypothetical protein